eukprot:gene16710-34272_t
MPGVTWVGGPDAGCFSTGYYTQGGGVLWLVEADWGDWKGVVAHCTVYVADFSPSAGGKDRSR